MATTKENVRAKVIALLDNIRPLLEVKLEKLLDSGLIEFEKEDDNWALPKDIIVAMAREVEYQYYTEFYGYNDRMNKLSRAISLGYSYEKL